MFLVYILAIEGLWLIAQAEFIKSRDEKHCWCKGLYIFMQNKLCHVNNMMRVRKERKN